jgi:hypothetical protein
MNIFQKIKSSIYSPVFYRDVPNQSFLSVLGYFLLLTLFLTLVQVVFLIKPLLFDLNREIKTYATMFISSFPSDLSVSIKSGKVTTTAVEPYFYAMPIQDVDENMKEFQNLLVIDTKNAYSVSQFNLYKSVFWLTSDSLFIRNGTEIKTVDLTQVPDFTFDKGFIQTLTSKILPLLWLLGPLFLTVVAIFIYMLSFGRLVYLFLLAFLIWIIAKIAKLSFTYGSIYKMGMYAMTLPLIVQLFVDLTSTWTHFNGISFMFSIMTLAMFVINLRDDSPKPSLTASESRQKPRSKKRKK